MFYSVTFGGFVGLSSYLPIFFRDQYGVSALSAGYLTAIAALVGSGLRPVGGYLADKFGGARVLSPLIGGIVATFVLESLLPTPELMMVLLVAGMAGMGMGSGAVFQLVPQCFRNEIGVATGVVGALGGVGGFLLPTLLGSIKEASGSFALGFLALAIIASGSLVLLRVLTSAHRGWRSSWHSPQMAAAYGEVGW